MIAVNLFHILLLGPLMIYIGYYKENNASNNINIAKFMLVGISAMLPFIVNVPRLDKLYMDYHRINLAHWTVMLAYFWYVSYLFVFDKTIDLYIYMSLLIIGIIVILVHLFKLIPKLIKKYNTNEKN
tara:strand:- start:162 stop:542 length:381 start_codon:yes stop_codon:yes gene_type:complete